MAKTRPIQALADAAADRYGIPRRIYRNLIKQESGWNPNAYNPSGATGLVQIHLPSHPDVTEEQARNPAFAADWGARYLAAQYGRFKRWDLALAAYNAGPGNVEKHGGVPPFKETRNYVKNILGGVAATSPTFAPPPVTSPPLGAAPKLGVPNPPAIDGLLASIFQSNNDLIGLDTPAPLLELLSRPIVAPSSIPNYGGLAPQPVSAPPPAAFVAPTSAQVKGMVPAFQSALDRLIAASGGKVTITSGYRSPERQAELYAAAVKKYGSEAAARKWVAPPGKSRHGHGDAADLGGDLNWVRANAARFGLYQPMSWEPWHWELKGSRG